MSYLDRTFCPPELVDKPDCAECWRKFDEYKYRMHCAKTGVYDDVSFSDVRLCEAENADILPKYHENTNFSKMVFHSYNANNDITCAKISGANTTKKESSK